MVRLMIEQSQAERSSNPVGWHHLCTPRSGIAALILLLAIPALAQESQFFFDPSGNLLAQTAETLAPPQILGQPQMQVIIPGELASFSVVVADTTAFPINGISITRPFRAPRQTPS